MHEKKNQQEKKSSEPGTKLDEADLAAVRDQLRRDHAEEHKMFQGIAAEALNSPEFQQEWRQMIKEVVAEHSEKNEVSRDPRKQK